MLPRAARTAIAMTATGLAGNEIKKCIDESSPHARSLLSRDYFTMLIDGPVFAMNGAGNRFFQTDLFPTVSQMLEQSIYLRSEGVVFEENRNSNGKSLAFFRGEDTESARKAMKDGRFIQIFNSYSQGFFFPQTIKKQGIKGHTAGFVSTSASILPCLFFSMKNNIFIHSALGDGKKSDDQIVASVLVTVPKSLAWVGDYLDGENKSFHFFARECVTQGTPSKDILGVIHYKKSSEKPLPQDIHYYIAPEAAQNPEKLPEVQSFEINPNFDFSRLKDIVFDKQMIPAINSLPDGKLKAQFLACVDPKEDMIKQFDARSGTRFRPI